MAAPAAQSPRGKKDTRTKATGTQAAKAPLAGATVHALPSPSLLALRKSEPPRERKSEPPTTSAKDAPKAAADERESSLAALTLVAHERASLLGARSRNAPPAPPRSSMPEAKPSMLAKTPATGMRLKGRLTNSPALNKRRNAADPTDYDVQIISIYQTPPVPATPAATEAAASPPPLPTARARGESLAPAFEETLTDAEVSEFVRPVMPRARILAMGGLVAVAAAAAVILPMLTTKVTREARLEAREVVTGGAFAEQDSPAATAPSHTETAVLTSSVTTKDPAPAMPAPVAAPQVKAPPVDAETGRAAEPVATREPAPLAVSATGAPQPLTAALIASPQKSEVEAPRATQPSKAHHSPRKHVAHRAKLSKKKHVRSYYDLVAKSSAAKRRSHR